MKTVKVFKEENDELLALIYMDGEEIKGIVQDGLKVAVDDEILEKVQPTKG